MSQLVPSLVFYVMVLALCLARPAAGRVFVGVFFLAMAVGVNVVLVIVAPGQFVALGTEAALLAPYRWFFENVVALAPPLFGLLAATYEVAIAAMILGGGRPVRWGLIGGIVFLLGITPLGVWTLANPVLALALAVLLRRDYGAGLPALLRSVPRPAPGRKERASVPPASGDPQNAVGHEKGRGAMSGVQNRTAVRRRPAGEGR